MFLKSLKDILLENKDDEYKALETTGLSGGQPKPNKDKKDTPFDNSKIKKKRKTSTTRVTKNGIIIYKFAIDEKLTNKLTQRYHEKTDRNAVFKPDDATPAEYYDFNTKMIEKGFDDRGYKISDENHLKHIARYTSDSSKLNGALNQLHKNPNDHMERGYFDQDFGEHTRHLDDLTMSHEVPQDMHVYSGLKGSPLKDKEHGLHYDPDTRKYDYDHIKAILPAFTSTSTEPHIANSFTMGDHDEDEKEVHRHMLKIHIPKGSRHGAYIGHHSGIPTENEFLMRRGVKLHIHPEPEVHMPTEKGRIRNNDRPTKIWHAKIVE